MRLFIKKLLNALFYIILFLSYSYVLFMSIMHTPVMNTRADVIRELVLALVLSFSTSGIICGLIWNFFSIEKEAKKIGQTESDQL